MKKTLYLVLALALLLAGFGMPTNSSAQDSLTPEFVEGPCAISVPAGEIEGETFICGTVEVPELHANPGGKTIQLSVVIVKGGEAPDPLVLFNGGPGSSALVLSTIFLDSPVRDDRDIVVYSDRGTPGANPDLECPEFDTAADDLFGAPMSDVFEARLAGYEACRTRLTAEDVNLNAYNNPARSADAAYVMTALGYDTFNVWGVSAGGFLAQLVNRDYPDRVNTVMTDSGSHPEAFMGAVFENILDSASSSFRTLFESCAVDAACNDAYPDLENTLWNMVAELNANPTPVTITHPVTGETADIMLTGDMILPVLNNSFSNVANMPRIINDIANGDYSYLLPLLAGQYVSEPGFSDGLYESVFCAEMGHFTFADLNTEDVYPQIIDALQPLLQFTVDGCDIWNVDPVERGPVINSETPVLIMEGVYDSNKQPELGRIVVENYETGYLAEFGDKAHVVLSSCAISMMAQFMNNPYQEPDMSCVPEKPNFVIPGAEITFSEQSFEDMGITAMIPDQWQELAPGIYADATGNRTLAISTVPGTDESVAVAAFAQGFGLSAFDKSEEQEINGRIWGVYLSMDGEEIRVLVATVQGENTYLVGLDTTLNNVSKDSENILRPVVESVRFME